MALAHLPRRALSEAEETDWRCGRRVSLQQVQGDHIQGNHVQGDVVLVLNHDQTVAGIGLREPEENLLRPKVVFGAIG